MHIVGVVFMLMLYIIVSEKKKTMGSTSSIPCDNCSVNR